MDSRRISLVLTSWDRFESTLEAFVNVVKDDRVDEIIIVDDMSDIGIYKKLEVAVSVCDKVKLFRNTINLGCYLNKRRAVELASNEYVILFDSDNIMNEKYINKIFEYEWQEDVILAPDFASPNFDYRAFGGITISKENVAEYMPMPMFSTALNTCNLFVNREKYLEVFDSSIDPVTCDSIYFVYCWLKAGYHFHITKGLQYYHAVHPLSHYKQNVHLTPPDLLPTIENNLKQMR